MKLSLSTAGIINRRVTRHSIMQALDKRSHVKLIYFFTLLRAQWNPKQNILVVLTDRRGRVVSTLALY
jgi:hypothetical protein